MIGAIMIAIYISVLWSSFAHTELGWLSWIFSAIICVCNVIAAVQYYKLLQRIRNIEKKTKKGGAENEV